MGENVGRAVIKELAYECGQSDRLFFKYSDGKFNDKAFTHTYKTLVKNISNSQQLYPHNNVCNDTGFEKRDTLELVGLIGRGTWANKRRFL